MGALFLAFGRMILVLGLVIGLLVVLARFGRKWQGGAGFGSKSAGHIEVVSRRSLGKNVSLLVVQVARRTFLVGQSAQQMTMLAELDGAEWSPATQILGQASDQLLTPGTARGIGENSPRAWDAFIDYLREMTVRH